MYKSSSSKPKSYLLNLSSKFLTLYSKFPILLITPSENYKPFSFNAIY